MGHPPDRALNASRDLPGTVVARAGAMLGRQGACMDRQRRHTRRAVFLLRIWEERSSEAPCRVLRLSLEVPHAEERTGFASPEALARYLTVRFAPWEPETDAGTSHRQQPDQPPPTPQPAAIETTM
jgi:hypothetical protein